LKTSQHAVSLALSRSTNHCCSDWSACIYSTSPFYRETRKVHHLLNT